MPDIHQLSTLHPEWTITPLHRPCALCGKNPATGHAGINDRWYCHGDTDPKPTCFQVQNMRDGHIRDTDPLGVLQRRER